jgi:tRNA dimethylallyltransferase
VISADSLQVYRGFDIGSAKPPKRILRQLPHHLIDIRDPREGFSAGDFVQLADRIVQDIAGRGLLPVLSGGTAFYLRNFLFGLPEVPPGGGPVRERLNADAAIMGPENLHRKLAEVDPVSASRIPAGNRVRVIRALEVWETTGRPLSSFPAPDRPRLHLNPLVIGLERDKGDLETRIRKRVIGMIEEGLATEIEGLLASGVPEDCPAMQGIGYREYLGWKRSGSRDTGSLVDEIVLHTRQYAKRQMTFFRSLPGVHWFHPEEVDKIRSITANFAANGT